MRIMDHIRGRMRSFLELEPPSPQQISIRESLDYEGNAIKNRIWYRGDASELEQLYGHIADMSTRQMFWAARATPGMEIRKIHTGLPSLIADVLAGIVVTNMNEFRFAEQRHDDIWQAVSRDSEVKSLVTRAVTETLYIGDGAFKVSIDPAVSDVPILEFYPGDRVEYTLRRGRVTEVIFKSPARAKNDKTCELREIYGMGYVRYELYADGKPAELDAAEGLDGLKDVRFGTEERPYMLAVPVRFSRSDRWEGRGQSIFDKKIGDFDALDEVWSQWLDALRSGRAKTYIPDKLLPRDPRTGALARPNAFDNRFIQTEADMGENAQNRIQTEQALIQHESYETAYTTALDLCLQGLVSPSTLGIDVKKVDNAEAQREKEKVTLYTRDRIVEQLGEILKRLAQTAVRAYCEMRGVDCEEEVKVDIIFGDYANPSFEAQVEAVSRARQSGIISTEAAVDELYGDTRDRAWKQAEVARIRAESAAH